MADTCPHLVTSDEMTTYCNLAETEVRRLRAQLDTLLAMVENVRDGMTEARSEGLTALPLTRLAEIVGDPIDNNHPQEIGAWDVERAALDTMQTRTDAWRWAAAWAAAWDAAWDAAMAAAAEAAEESDRDQISNQEVTP